MQLYLIAVVWQLIAITLAYSFDWGIKTGESYWQALRFAVFQVGDILNGVDLLPMYSLLLLWGLVVLYLLEKRKLRWVMVFSWALWYARLLTTESFSFFGQNFNPATWQILFVLGLLAGYYRKQLHLWEAKLPGPRWVWVLSLWIVSARLWYLSWMIVFRDIPVIRFWFLFGDTSLNKLVLNPARILVSVLIFLSLYEATKIFWRFLVKGLGWLMIPLGQNSLIAYTIQATLGYSKLFLPGYPFAELHNAIRALMQVAGLLFTWLLTILIVSGKPFFIAKMRSFRGRFTI